MRLEELLECDASTLEKMSDADLLKHFEPYLNVTRPELCKKPSRNEPTPAPIYLSPQKKAALDALRAQGIDTSFIYRRRK